MTREGQKNAGVYESTRRIFALGAFNKELILEDNCATIPKKLWWAAAVDQEFSSLTVERIKGYEWRYVTGGNQVYSEKLTYPITRCCGDMRAAMDKLLALYLEVVSQCDFLTFDRIQLKLLGCFY